MSAFVSEEMTNKIKDFKARYERGKGVADENKTHFYPTVGSMIVKPQVHDCGY